MTKHVDHLVWAVQDLERAKTYWEALGFQASPKGIHPFGTANHLLMGDQFFLELLGVYDVKKLIPTTKEMASFSGLNQAFLQQGEGVSMIVLSSEDASADFEKYQSLGLEAYPPIHFSRGVVLPNGEEAKLAFSIAFVLHPQLPRLSFFVCQHHYPEHFWKKEYQKHPNGFLQLKAIEIVIDRPAELVSFFSKILNVEYKLDTGVYQFKTRAEEILLMDINTFCQKNDLPDNRVGECVRLVSFKVKELIEVENNLVKNGIEIYRKMDQFILMKDKTSETWIKFEK